ncbi:hypothetical protein GCM10020220_029840 [Nonomuraea rubra]|uniref:helix-turn-helix transcriptional regulator n=1 Tax=Nonomuraea rubra TaxID=46180 RepID=UPI0031EFB4CB
MLTATHWANAVLCNGLGRYEEAYAAVEQGAANLQSLAWPSGPRWSSWSPRPARDGTPRAADAARTLDAMARACGTDWALGASAVARAQVSEGPAADALYREAVERLGRTGVRVTIRPRPAAPRRMAAPRRTAARRRASSWVPRTSSSTGSGSRRSPDVPGEELEATGETVRTRSAEPGVTLTAQEAQIARLAGDGLTNSEIGARLFISPHTVEWHLRKVFTKLVRRLRRQLRGSLPEGSLATA